MNINKIDNGCYNVTIGNRGSVLVTSSNEINLNEFAKLYDYNDKFSDNYVKLEDAVIKISNDPDLHYLEPIIKEILSEVVSYDRNIELINENKRLKEENDYLNQEILNEATPDIDKQAIIDALQQEVEEEIQKQQQQQQEQQQQQQQEQIMIGSSKHHKELPIDVMNLRLMDSLEKVDNKLNTFMVIFCAISFITLVVTIVVCNSPSKDREFKIEYKSKNKKLAPVINTKTQKQALKATNNN